MVPGYVEDTRTRCRCSLKMDEAMLDTDREIKGPNGPKLGTIGMPLKTSSIRPAITLTWLSIAILFALSHEQTYRFSS